MELTINYINRLSYNDGEPLPEASPPKRDIRWDGKIPGFGIRLYPTGKKTYVLSYRINKRKRLITLGRDGVITLKEARDKAKSELGKISDGLDPLETKQKAAKGETFKVLCGEYLERYAKVYKKSWKDDERRLNKHLIPALGSYKVDGVTKKDIACLHGKIGDNTPYEANRTLELLAKMFDFAVERGFIDEGKANPAHGIKAYPEVKRDRWVTPEELPALAEAIDLEAGNNYYASKAIWLYLLTGARKNELLTAKWEYIDTSRNELKIPDNKSGHVHYIPLSPAALELLNGLRRMDNNPYIFPGKVKGKHLVNISKPWIRIRKTATLILWQQKDKLNKIIAEAKGKLDEKASMIELHKEISDLTKGRKIELPVGLTDVRIHDLRRTLGSWLAQSGNSLHLIGKVLNHSNQSTTAIYARFAQDHVRRALDDHGEKLMIAAGKQRSDNVVPLKKKTG